MFIPAARQTLIEHMHDGQSYWNHSWACNIDIAMVPRYINEAVVSNLDAKMLLDTIE